MDMDKSVFRQVMAEYSFLDALSDDKIVYRNYEYAVGQRYDVLYIDVMVRWTILGFIVGQNTKNYTRGAMLISDSGDIRPITLKELSQKGYRIHPWLDSEVKRNQTD